MNLSPPTNLIFLISVVIAVLGVLAALNIVNFIPLAAVWLVTIGFGLLAAGCLFKGI